MNATFPKTLIYCGASNGYGLTPLVHKYDQIFAFEADPDTHRSLSVLMSPYSWVKCIHAACSTNYGTAALYRHPQRVSTSLGQSMEINCPPGSPYGGSSGRKHPDDAHVSVVLVPTINLGDFLTKRNVYLIDHYVSDCQGSDLNVLRTMKPYLNDGRICTLYVETFTDRQPLYKGLDNSFSKFKELLSPNYKIEKITLGRTNQSVESESQIPPFELEWDTLWRLKSPNQFFN